MSPSWVPAASTYEPTLTHEPAEAHDTLAKPTDGFAAAAGLKPPSGAVWPDHVAPDSVSITPHWLVPLSL
jgi:hypothetical protein